MADSTCSLNETTARCANTDNKTTYWNRSSRSSSNSNSSRDKGHPKTPKSNNTTTCTTTTTTTTNNPLLLSHHYSHDLPINVENGDSSSSITNNSLHQVQKTELVTSLKSPTTGGGRGATAVGAGGGGGVGGRVAAALLSSLSQSSTHTQTRRMLLLSSHDEGNRSRSPSSSRSSRKGNNDHNDITILKKKSSDEDSGDIKAYSTFNSFSTKSKLMLVLCAFAYFLSGTTFSLIAPFYPKEAEMKGMSLTTTGLVFSLYEFVIFIFAPFYGKFLTSTIGIKFGFVSGVFVGGICNILFGTLDKCPSGTPFIALSIACRCMEALGFSCFITAIMTIVASEFPSYVITSIALLETSNGIGLMVGPAIGGALYEIGGFGLPFYVLGALILLNGLFIYLVFPTPKVFATKKKIAMFTLLRSPMVVIPMVSICLCSAGITFMEPTLAKHLEPFGLSTAVVGLVFVICPCMYAVFSIIWGYLTDKKGIQNTLLVVGHAIFGVGMFFLGPSSVFAAIGITLPFELWTVIVGLILVGFSFGCLSVPSLKCMLVGAVELGYEENIDTYAVVSGLLNSVYFFGAFLGPMAGAFFIQEFGYPRGYTIMGSAHVFLAFVTFFFFVGRHYSCCGTVRKMTKRTEEENEENEEEYQPLLSSCKEEKGGEGLTQTITIHHDDVF